ncbi:MAG: hypothetical protein J6A25_02875 [Lachnospiraceae bacterium]|nr:hypothetical protein [Lachnospiraceae bacterium]
MKYPRIKDLYDIIIKTTAFSGIFDMIKSFNFDKPDWFNDLTLDMLYKNHSRNKLLNTYITDEILSESDTDSFLVLAQYLGEIVLAYIPKWDRIWIAMNETYNPLDNEKYKIIREELITDKKNKKTEHENIIDVKVEHNEADTENVDNNSSSVSTEKERTNNNDYFYGFNSENGVGTSGTENNNITDNDSNTRTKQDRQYVSKSDRDSLTKDNLDKTEDENNERNIESMDTHSGNNGRNTFQDLLNQELEVRKNLFYEIVFTDIDSVLTIPVY